MFHACDKDIRRHSYATATTRISRVVLLGHVTLYHVDETNQL